MQKKKKKSQRVALRANCDFKSYAPGVQRQTSCFFWPYYPIFGNALYTQHCVRESKMVEVSTIAQLNTVFIMEDLVTCYYRKHTYRIQILNQHHQNVKYQDPGVLSFISWRAKGSSKIYAGGPNEHNFLSFSYIFLCIPEVMKGPNYTGWQARFGLWAAYWEPLYHVLSDEWNELTLSL